jgi:hypothetical protein
MHFNLIGFEIQKLDQLIVTGFTLAILCIYEKFLLLQAKSAAGRRALQSILNLL